MTIRLNPYLSFRGNAREAMEFYHSVFGGDLTLNTFEELHAAQDPSENNQIMHSQLVVDDTLTLMGSDTTERWPYNPGDNFQVSLSGGAADEAVLTDYWNRLIVGANVTAPLAKAVWGDSFGMCTDKFGTRWLINISAA
jgi:PhnB protein